MLHRLQLTCKKMIGAGDERQAFRFGGSRGYMRQLWARRKAVAVSAEKQLGNEAILKEGVMEIAAIGLRGQSEQSESADVCADRF